MLRIMNGGSNVGHPRRVGSGAFLMGCSCSGGLPQELQASEMEASREAQHTGCLLRSRPHESRPRPCHVVGGARGKAGRVTRG